MARNAACAPFKRYGEENQTTGANHRQFFTKWTKIKGNLLNMEIKLLIEGVKFKIFCHIVFLLMLDRVIAAEPGKSLTAIKNVTFNEQFFQGHFPESPVMPGVLDYWSDGASLWRVGGDVGQQRERRENEITLFAGLDNVCFKNAKWFQATSWYLKWNCWHTSAVLANSMLWQK